MLKPLTEERRAHPRIPYIREVRYGYRDVEHFREVHAANLSISGMFIQTARPEPQGTLVFLEFTEEGGQRIFSACGRVVHVAERGAAPGMGIEFVQLGAESRERLFSILGA